MNSEATISLVPGTVDELREIVRADSLVIPVGGGSKRPLFCVENAKPISLKQLSGIIQYDPSEYTFTAYSGTPIEEVKAVLKEKRQYLPFAPVLGESGATLGGSVASGLSGSGRFRFGGVRDFLLETRFIDGSGKLISAGGKVVKNAAGFDIPKLMVGSLGRLGILTELTFKVFPAPELTVTVALECASHSEAQQRLVEAARSPWELDALDYQPSERVLLMRLGGSKAANLELAARIAKRWRAAAVLDESESDALWRRLREFKWAPPASCVAKVPVTPGLLPSFITKLESIKNVATHIAAGGMCAWVAVEGTENLAKLEKLLIEQGRLGLVFRGNCANPWLGEKPNRRIDRDIKEALDPDMRYPEF